MHADRAQLIRRVRIPRFDADAPIAGVLEVLVERAREQRTGETSRLSSRTYRDRRRRRVEVSQLYRARDVVELALDHHLPDRFEQIRAETAPDLREFSRLGLGQLLGDERRVLESPQREEIIPVGMHRFRAIAFMAYRLRQ